MFTVILPAASCAVVTPVAPTEVDAVCRAGVASVPTLTLPTTDKITYSVDKDPPYAPLQQVVVTATLTATGVAWPAELPTGWTRKSDTTATWTVFFAYGACIPVSPVDPEIHLASCVNGAVTVPTVTAATGPTGISYVVDPAGPLTPGTVAHTVSVTATLADGYGWGQLGTGWLPAANAASKMFTVILPAASCAVVTPVAPTVVDAVCRGGVASVPTLTLPTTDKITYSVDKDRAVCAVAAGGGDGDVDGDGGGLAGDVADGVDADVGSTTATCTVFFAYAACIPVSPVAPDGDQASCANGAVTVPTVTAATGPTGVSYVVDPAGPYDAGHGGARR